MVNALSGTALSRGGGCIALKRLVALRLTNGMLGVSIARKIMPRGRRRIRTGETRPRSEAKKSRKSCLMVLDSSELAGLLKSGAVRESLDTDQRVYILLSAATVRLIEVLSW